VPDVEESVNARMLPETEEASTAMEQQPQSRQYPFVPPARVSVMKDSRIESEDTIDKRNKREKRKNKNNTASLNKSGEQETLLLLTTSWRGGVKGFSRKQSI
jgi:hypothetical protein